MVAVATSPVAIDTFDNPRPESAPKIMTSSLVHAPPRGFRDAAQTSRNSPLVTSTILRRPSAKNPTRSLAGDQNGSVASVLPAYSRGVRSFIPLTHNVA
jgi:hypothetical protein